LLGLLGSVYEGALLLGNIGKCLYQPIELPQHQRLSENLKFLSFPFLSISHQPGNFFVPMEHAMSRLLHGTRSVLSAPWNTQCLVCSMEHAMSCLLHGTRSVLSAPWNTQCLVCSMEHAVSCLLHGTRSVLSATSEHETRQSENS